MSGFPIDAEPGPIENFNPVEMPDWHESEPDEVEAE